MKILLAIVLFVFCAFNLCGQSRTMRHLFNDKPKNLSLFISPTIQYTQIIQQNCRIPGIRGGMIINKKVALGGIYEFTMKDILIPVKKGGGKLGMKSVGMLFEYTIWPLRKLHLTIPVSTGIGQLKITDNLNGITTGNPNFFFAQPGLMMEINSWKYTKVGFGVSYRYTANVSYNSLTTNDLNGLSFVASINFGNFNYASRKKNKQDPSNHTEPKTKKISTPKSKMKKPNKELTH
jgi:hypothetical protein